MCSRIAVTRRKTRLAVQDDPCSFTALALPPILLDVHTRVHTKLVIIENVIAAYSKYADSRGTILWFEKRRRHGRHDIH